MYICFLVNKSETVLEHFSTLARPGMTSFAESSHHQKTSNKGLWTNDFGHQRTKSKDFVIRTVLSSMTECKQAGKMADRCKFLVEVFACFLALCLFPAPLTASPELLFDSYGQIAQQFGLKFSIPQFSYDFGNISTPCKNSLYALISNGQYMQLCKYL